VLANSACRGGKKVTLNSAIIEQASLILNGEIRLTSPPSQRIMFSQ
jgi:hypothetical protein